MVNYRIDHIAWRTLDRNKCVKFFVDVMGYVEQETFDIFFNDEKTETAICTVLQPGNRVSNTLPWTFFGQSKQRYVLEPEIFVSEGSPGSIVYNWASKRGGAGIHHIALQVPENSTIEKEMQIWKEKGWVEKFTTNDPIICEEMKQIFTPLSACGVVFELIERKDVGFCRSSVRDLMLSTKGD